MTRSGLHTARLLAARHDCSRATTTGLLATAPASSRAAPALPGWVRPWCRQHLHDEPVAVLFVSEQTSTVIGLRLGDGTEVVLKARDDDGRAPFPRPPGRPPTLPPVGSSEAFLTAYEARRQRPFSTDEREIAWAAGVWAAAHHARWESLMSNRTPVAGDALRAQVAERLRRADA